MKAVKNTAVSPIKKDRQREYLQADNNYWCITCGALNSGVAYYYETAYGEATLCDLEGTLEEYETTRMPSPDGSQVEVDHYACRRCNEESRHIDCLFTGDPPYVEDEEDEEEDG